MVPDYGDYGRRNEDIFENFVFVRLASAFVGIFEYVIYYVSVFCGYYDRYYIVFGG